eukprot:TRINITY_DN13709_c0_g1_i1.p1 TRINITY_DN13709_c0_g1~~TRINITY_DN13709_c0_g1_i1.p1  ORF type:complete len:322 (-),score=53.89 TRINITY_DN13709_c0_g1_i1:147-1112(-)
MRAAMARVWRVWGAHGSPSMALAAGGIATLAAATVPISVFSKPAVGCSGRKSYTKDSKAASAPKNFGAILYGDMLYERREVFLTGSITHNTAKEVIAQLLYLERQDPGRPITLLIDSGGGKVAAGMAIHDVMRELSSPVRTLCLGRCSSMGAVLLAAGEHGERWASPNCRIMIHQPRIGAGGKKKSKDLRIVHEEIEHSRLRSQRLLTEYTGESPERLEELLQADYHMSATEAKDLGLVDKIGSIVPTSKRGRSGKAAEAVSLPDTPSIPESLASQQTATSAEDCSGSDAAETLEGSEDAQDGGSVQVVSPLESSTDPIVA